VSNRSTPCEYSVPPQVGKMCLDELHWDNKPWIMAQCGSKGSMNNITQVPSVCAHACACPRVHV
jgi:hypothetical protein